MNTNKERCCEERKTYTVAEIANILGISKRSAYNFCAKTKAFRVLRLGSLVRIHQESFDRWFHRQEAATGRDESTWQQYEHESENI